MKLFVIDNGGDYSDHRVLFLNTTESRVRVAILAAALYSPKAFVVAETSSQAVQWFQGKPMVLEDFIEDRDFRFYDEESIAEVTEEARAALDLDPHDEDLKACRAMLTRRIKHE